MRPSGSSASSPSTTSSTVIQDEADDEIKALGGVKADEELSDSVWNTVRSRFAGCSSICSPRFWRLPCLACSKANCRKWLPSPCSHPLWRGSGGVAATQTMTVAVRALATRDLGAANAMRVTLRETAVGLLNGVGFGIITGVIAGLWFREFGIGAVIALAMTVNLVAGALGGILIPLALERFRVTRPCHQACSSPRSPMLSGSLPF